MRARALSAVSCAVPILSGQVQQGIAISEGLFGGDAATLLQPFAQVDESAALAAKGPPGGVRGPGDVFAAGGTGYEKDTHSSLGLKPLVGRWLRMKTGEGLMPRADF